MSRWFRVSVGTGLTLVWLSCAFAAVGDAAQAPTGSRWQIPDSAATEVSPLAGAAALSKGQALFRAKCQRCHGTEGDGRGPDSDPNQPAGDLTDGRAAARNPDGVLFYKIWNGRAKPKMPAMKLDLTRDDVWRLVVYVKTLRK